MNICIDFQEDPSKIICYEDWQNVSILIENGFLLIYYKKRLEHGFPKNRVTYICCEYGESS